MKTIATTLIIAVLGVTAMAEQIIVPTTPGALRIASFNILVPGGNRPGNQWDERIPRIIKLLDDHQIDLVGTQETTLRQINEIVKDGVWDYVGVAREDGKTNGEYMAIFFRKDRFVCEENHSFWLSETPDVPGSRSWKTACTRMCTYGRFRDLRSGKRFVLCNTHLDHVSDLARVNGIKLILSRQKEITQGLPLLLTGDFNATREHEFYKLVTQTLADSEFISETPHVGPNQTFHALNYDPDHEQEKRRIDFIFVSSGIRVLTHRTIDDRDGALYPSDHFPVAIDAVLPDTPPEK